MKAMTIAGLAGCAAAAMSAGLAWAATLETYTVVAAAGQGSYEATGTVEGVRQATVAAQVAGRITEVSVRSGEHVPAGALLLRIAPGDAADIATASSSGAAGAAARLASARADYERAQRLRAQEFISLAAMQKAEAAWQSAEAEAKSMGAEARGAQARVSWYTIRAPFPGHVTDVRVSVGDMATPGSPLLAIVDPTALRVVAHLPEMLAAQLATDEPAQLVSLAGAGPRQQPVSNWWVVPTVDPATHSVEVRAPLPAASTLEPGQFARLLLPLRPSAAQLRIPVNATVRRGEMTGVYVVATDGKPYLRQLRLGPRLGEQVVVLAGLKSGEQIALDPIAAARL